MFHQCFGQELLLRTLQSGMQPDDVSWEVNFVWRIAVHVTMSIVQTVESVESVEWMCSNPGLDAGSWQRQAMGDGGHESCQDPWRPETINSMRFDDEIGQLFFTEKIFKASYCQSAVFVAQCPSPTQASSIGFGRGLKPFSSSAAVSRCKMQTAHETIVNSSLKHC